MGQGTTFFFTVTLGRTDAMALAPDSGVLGACKDLTVLVVDDNPLARELMRAMAQSLGWRVEVACDGAQALGMLDARTQAGQPPVDAILSIGICPAWMAGRLWRKCKKCCPP